MANANQIITYWKHKSTGCIYKYFGHTKPYMMENYVQVTGWEYDEAMRIASEKYFGKN